MTKDRRLGRGLAALLGTQIEEGASESVAVSAPQAPLPQSQSVSDGAEMRAPKELGSTRNETIRSLATEAHARPVASSRPSVVPTTIPLAKSQAARYRVHQYA